MNEQEWLTSDSPEALLLYLRDRASERKLRLFAVACLGMVRHLLTTDCTLEVIRLTEQWADELEMPPALQEAAAQNYTFLQTLRPYTNRNIATKAVNAVAGMGAWAAAWLTVGEVRMSLRPTGARAVQANAPRQAALLRHIIGNPFARRSFDPLWRTAGALAIAQAAYEDRRWEDLPFLADALEETGCTDAAMLAHCREPGEHVRGCWVLDLILDRE